MSRLLAIGEALIDFIPTETGKTIAQVEGFQPKVGGAPANVCGAFAKLGGEAYMITQLGKDPFGDKIIEEFEKYHIGTDYILRTDKANTSLAFVSLGEHGSREFSFYRNPGADMLYEPEALQREWFQEADILHFCSVSLGDFPMKESHKKAVSYAKEQGMIISFDPNLRFPLWKSKEKLKAAVDEFLGQADILKISEEELEFITGTMEIKEALPKLFQGEVKLVVYTKGAQGAAVYTKNAKAEKEGIPVTAIDTTGAGDGFIGAFLYCLSKAGVDKETLYNLTAKQLYEYVEFAVKFSTLSVIKEGAISSYPSFEEVDTFV